MSTPAGARLTALDLFRGLAVAGMILVNTPGSWEHVWWPLDHAAWHGCTPTDLVFPSFLFAVGVALGLSFPRALDAADRRKTWIRIARRSAALIGLGLFFALIVHGDLATLRLPGVLQRIGLCYALAAGIAVLTARPDADGRAALDWRVLLGLAAGALLVYALLLLAVPVPGHGAGDLSPEGNLAGYVDRLVFGTAHMWSQGTDAAGNIVYDPEGLLSTLPSLANVLFGMLAAVAWKRRPDRALGWIAIGGVVLIVLGLALTPVLPLNKRLWTSSFALFTSGAASLVLAATMLATRSPAAVRLMAPLRVFGMNAILAYIVSILVEIAGFKIVVAPGLTLQGWCYDRLTALLGDPLLASHAYAVLVVLLILLMLIPLHRRGIHLRL